MFVQWLDEDGAEAEDAAEDGDEDGGALGDDHHTPKTTFHLLFTVFVQDASFSVIFFFSPSRLLDLYIQMFLDEKLLIYSG